MKYSFVIILLSFFLIDIYSQENPSPCNDLDMDEFTQKECLSDLILKLDQQLDVEYNKYLKDNSELYKDIMDRNNYNKFIKSIKESQDLWKKFREAESAVIEYESWGGSGASKFAMLCQIKLTLERIKRFQDIYYYSDFTDYNK